MGEKVHGGSSPPRGVGADHTPEFDFEAVPGNDADYVAENAITYPVALDPSRAIWRTWDNHY